MFGVLLVSCATVCSSHLYIGWADHPDRRKCFCGVEVVDKSAPPPMPITLKWKASVPEENRVSDRVTPDPPKFPRWEIPTEPQEPDDE